MRFDALAKQYRGETAKDYEKDRKSPKWRTEQSIVSQLLATFSRGSTILDIPVGTGRFIPIYTELGMRVVGMDISDDMLAEAAAKSDQLSDAIRLFRSDIRNIDATDEQFDCVVCMRFINWIETPQLELILKELARVSKKFIIVSIRHFVPLTKLGSFAEVGTLKRFLRQIKRRIYGQNGLTFHSQASVDRSISSAGLAVREAVLVEARSDGTDYYIYLLEKRA